MIYLEYGDGSLIYLIIYIIVTTIDIRAKKATSIAANNSL